MHLEFLDPDIIKLVLICFLRSFDKFLVSVNRAPKFQKIYLISCFHILDLSIHRMKSNLTMEYNIVIIKN